MQEKHQNVLFQIEWELWERAGVENPGAVARFWSKSNGKSGRKNGNRIGESRGRIKTGALGGLGRRDL